MFDELLQTPSGQFGRITRFLVFQVKLWIHCGRLLKKNRAGLQAAALSYYTVFGLVPLAVVTLMVFQFFPTYKDAGHKIKESVYTQLHLSTIEYPDPANADKMIKLTDNLDAIVARVFTGLNQGTLAAIGLLLIIISAIMMLSTIERSFNNIWGVSRGRGILQRTVNYWALLTLVPLLAATAIGIATRYSRINELQKTIVSHLTPVVVSYLVAIIGFCVMYLVLPNTRVKVRAAIWGAAMAALAWMVVKWGFKLYVTKFIPYNEIYGVLGLIPLGVFWIYISWNIVLFGLQLTYTTQHLHTLDAAEIAAATKKTDEFFIASELTIMNIVGEIASAFQKGGGVVEPAVVSNKLNIPIEFVERILGHLVGAGLLVRVSEPKDGFMPAQDPGNMKLADIAEVVSKACFAQSPQEQSAGLQQVARLQREALSQFTVKQLLGVGPDEDAVPKNIPVANPQDFTAAVPQDVPAAQPHSAAATEPKNAPVTRPNRFDFPKLRPPPKPQDGSDAEPQDDENTESQIVSATTLKSPSAAEPQNAAESENAEKKEKIKIKRTISPG